MKNNNGALRIRGGLVIDPSVKLDKPLDIIIENGRIKDLVNPSENYKGEYDDIDASGKLVVPGLVDMHTHLREPGQEYKEGIEAGTRAAAAGGITSVACMANTIPTNDNASVTDYIIRRAAEFGFARVYPIGAVTKGLKGVELAEMGELANSGCVAFSDDGKPLMNAELMRRALEYSSDLNRKIIVHEEDANLAQGGSMNEGEFSTRLGLAGIPNAAEEVMIARDIILARMTGAPIHFAHVSTAGGVESIRRAKQQGINVTAETCPHYFLLTEESVIGYDTRSRVNPPLRSKKDVEAIRAGLKDGTIDCIASDHAPHASHEKNVEYEIALCGISGIETLLALSLKLVADDTLSYIDLIRKLSTAPAKILGIEAGSLAVGVRADITIIDPDAEWVVNPAEFKSKGKFTPFEGMKLHGRAIMTLLDGKVVKI